jgi:aryl-alcohol dehydrogenase-like predicted oxidoreductase
VPSTGSLTDMDTRAIGELAVSVVGLGCNQFGTAACDEATSLRVIHEAIDSGIAFFDVADEYGMNYFDPSDPEGWGRSEEILGKALKGHRDEVVIASKFGAHPHADTEGRGGNSARWARIAIDDSLRRLGTDRVDLYQVHFPDPAVPIEETLGVLGEIVAAGKVREIGCCNFTGEAIREAAEASRSRELPAFASSQSALNLFRRSALDDEIPACEELGMSFLPYYPLASGMLTGKYRRGADLPAGTRLSGQVDDDTRRRLFSPRTFARLEALETFAAERGHTLLELAFAWLLAQPTVASVIAGAAKPGQAAANAAAAGWDLSAEDAARATDVVAQAA